MSERDSPLITVGIPTYNRPQGLANTLQKVSQQTYKNLEILISDNATNDCEAVDRVINSHKADGRIHFFRQNKNLGSLGNFRFLVNSAKGDYFLWISDDDNIELNYIELIVNKLRENPDAAIVMGGYDVEDLISAPPITVNLTKHLFDLVSDSSYERMKAYILQPDHLGKSRLHWGLFPRKLIRQVFEDCSKKIPLGEEPVWFYFPIDFRLLSHGTLAIEDKLLWHVKLLPSSDGKSHLSGSFEKLVELTNQSAHSMMGVVDDSDVSSIEKNELKNLIKKKAKKDKVQLFLYYRVIGKWPFLARIVKVLWYKFFS